MKKIAEGKIAEDKLKENEARYKELTESISDVFFAMDGDLRYTYWNKASEKLTGIPAEKVIGKTLMEVYPDNEARQQAKDLFQKTMQTKKSQHLVVTYPGDQNITHEINSYPTTEGVSVFVRDITESKKIEAKLAERSKLLDEAQKVAGMGVYKTDFIKNRWESSEILDGIFGIDKDYVRSVDGWASLVHPDDRKMITEYLQNEVFAKKHDFDKEYRIVQKNSGETRWVSGLGKMTFDNKNKPLTMVGTIQDISERKEGEIILKESENRYRTLVDVAPLCIKWFDAQGNLVSVNQHGKEEHFLVGKSDEEIKKWKYMECIGEKYRDLVSESMKKALEGKSSEFDMEHVPGTATGHWCHSYLVPAAGDKGKVKYVLFISRDFTSEKIAEDEKNKNMEMLEKFKDLTVGRELRMIELKKKIEELTGKTGNN